MLEPYATLGADILTDNRLVYCELSFSPEKRKTKLVTYRNFGNDLHSLSW